MTMLQSKPRLLTIEGGEGAGKSTVLSALRDALLADTAQFGILRLIVSDHESAKKALKDNGFTWAAMPWWPWKSRISPAACTPF